MSLAEFGLYNWLLDYSWHNESKPCFLENDAKKLARLIGQPLASYLKAWSGIQKKFELWIDPRTEVEYFYNRRLYEEYSKRLAIAEKQAARSAKGHAARWGERHASSMPEAMPQALDKQCLNDAPIQSTVYKGKKNIANSSRYTAEFLEFWDSSSRRGSKWDAFLLWKRIPSEEHSIVKAAMIHEVKHTWPHIEERLIPHVEKWLRGKRWETVVLEPTAKGFTAVV